MIKVQDNAFVDQDGRRVIFRGLCFSDLHKLVDDGKWNKAHFQVAKEWGSNIIRIPIHPLLVRERGITEYLTYLDQGIRWAEDLGLYVIIDWHSIGNLKENKFPRKFTARLGRRLLIFGRRLREGIKENQQKAS